MTTPSLVERVRKELESVPCKHQHGCIQIVWHHDLVIRFGNGLQPDKVCRPEPDYQALAEKVAGWVEGLEGALARIEEESHDENSTSVAHDTLAALPWRKAVTP